jgi:hypothetical protein
LRLWQEAGHARLRTPPLPAVAVVGRTLTTCPRAVVVSPTSRMGGNGFAKLTDSGYSVYIIYPITNIVVLGDPAHHRPKLERKLVHVVLVQPPR